MRPDRPSTALGTVWDELDGGESRAPSRYAWGGELGRGGMGVVRCAKDVWLDREVAVKRPRGDLPQAVRERMLREARVTARLVHPGIVPVFDAGEDDDGPFYTMPILTGHSLDEVLREPVEVGVAVRVVAEAARALAYAHSKGVVHRDVKPANIVLGEGGEVWVVDWGVAWLRDEPTSDRVGTPGFAAPEQLEGQVSPQCDVYGLGRVLKEAVVNPPSDLAAVIARSTAVDPTHRYASAKGLAEELDRWLSGLRVRAHAYPLGELLRRWVRDHQLLVAVTCMSALLLFGVAGVAWSRTQAERARADVAYGQSLARGAVARAQEGRRPEAEVLAARALDAADSPVARGVLWPWLGVERAAVMHRWTPPCESPVLLDRGDVVCVEGGEARVFSPRGELQSAYRAPTELLSVARAGEVPGGLVVQAGDTGVWWLTQGPPRLVSEGFGFSGFVAGDAFAVHDGRRVGWLENDAIVWTDPLCDVRIEAARTHEGALWVACRDGTASLGTLREPGPTLKVPGYGSTWANTSTPVLGTFDGLILRWNSGWTSQPSPVGPLQRLVALTSGALLAHGERGEARVVWRDGRQLAIPGEPRDVAGGDELVVLDGEVQVRRLVLPPYRALDRVVEGGISTVAVSPSGDELLIGSATGEVVTWAPETNRVEALRGEGNRSTKGLAYLGEREVVFEHNGEVVTQGSSTERTGPNVLVHLGAASQGHYAYTPYGPVVRFTRLEGDHREQALTARASALLGDSEGFTVGVPDGHVLRFSAAGDLQSERDLGVPIHHLAQDGPVLVAASGSTVRWFDDAGARWTVELDAPVTALDVGRDGVVAGLRDGTLVLLAGDGSVQAKARAHDRLVSAVVFRGDEVFSASWDGWVRRWPLVGWPTDSLVDEVESEWGISLEASLDL